MCQPVTPPIAPRRKPALPRIILVVLVASLIPGIPLVWLSWRSPHPKYTAWVLYRVVPRQNPAIEGVSPVVPNDQLALLVARQRILITDDFMLEILLTTDAFHFDYHDMSKSANERRKGPFCLDNLQDSKEALRHAINVIAVPDTGLFRITISGDDPNEMYIEMQALALVYENFLYNRINVHSHDNFLELCDTRRDLEQGLEIAQQSVDAFRHAHDVLAVSQSISRLSQSVLAMDKSLAAAENDEKQAHARIESIQRPAASTATAEPLEMPADMDHAAAALTDAQTRVQELQTRINNQLLQLRDLADLNAEYQTRIGNLERTQQLWSEVDRKIRILEANDNADAALIQRFSESGAPK